MRRPLPVSLLIAIMTQATASSVPVVFDTDIQGDVDDVGAVAVLHALARRGEARILAMGVCAKNPDCAPCLSALNSWSGRPDIPIGWNHGSGFFRESRYAGAIAKEFPHPIAAATEAPPAVSVYRRALAAADDGSVVVVTVGQLSNMAALVKSDEDSICPWDGVELVRRKVRVWVCMGGRFPSGREANFVNDGPAAAFAIEHWPTPVVFSGFEIGEPVGTGAGFRELPAGNPYRCAYELFNGLQDRASWDQTAVLYAVRGVDGHLDELWEVATDGACHVAADGANEWRPHCPARRHAYLVQKATPRRVADVIEQLMLEGARQGAK